MTDLLLQYKDSEGNTSERYVSDIAVEGGDSIVAFCHLRQEKRTFKINRIQSAVDPATDEIIADVLVFLDVRPLKASIPIPPRVYVKPAIPSGEELRRLRTREKFELWRPYRYAVIADLYRKKFFSLFANRCFKCKIASYLEIDHHVPMVLGGHLIPGNLVALCPRCNNRKLDRSPAEFYSPEELENLAPILEREYSFFAFKFDWEFWNKDRKGYLLHLGVEVELVEEALNNPDNQYYVPPPVSCEDASVEITFDLSVLTNGS